MLSSRRFSHAADRGSAALAHHRLLTDRATRKGRAARAAAAHHVHSAGLLPPLSPADQRALVQEIANSLDDCYVARTAYLDDFGLTIATVRSRVPVPGGVSGTQRICVDCAGNVSITAYHAAPTPPSLRAILSQSTRPAVRVQRITAGLVLLALAIAVAFVVAL